MLWILSWVALAIFFLCLLFRVFRKRIFAAMCSRFADEKIFDEIKTKLFKRLDQQARKSKDTIKVLEIGGGSGSNFKFVQSRVDWTVTEPNLCFEKFFIKSSNQWRERHNIGNLVEAYGEDLGQFESNSFDAVIITLVLCSVQDIQKTLSEVRRVLKPGGVFYFLEHVRAPCNEIKLQKFQDFVSNHGIWPAICDGCYLNRETKMELNKSGFSKLEVVDCTFDIKIWLLLYKNPNPYGIYGWATK